MRRRDSKITLKEMQRTSYSEQEKYWEAPLSTPLAERLKDGLSLAVVGVLAALLVFAVGFVSGGVYTVRKHQDMYCPQPPGLRGYEFQAPDGQRIVGVRTGCRDGEDLFK